ncbi:MAG: PTS sugar transporter subunit IIA [Treponema sp.]|jgi:PTS system nitrogen regulatory IIA component|nr:PTS sugar transporter subunit IIA [Treponema sp.]
MPDDKTVKNEILTIAEVAEYLRVSERTIYDWAQKGEIPAGKIGTVWRFMRPEIEKWASGRLSANKLNSPPKRIHPDTFLSPDRIIFLESKNRQDALLTLAENLSAAPQIKNPHELASEILKREKLMSTAIGRGIAIPHVRLSSITDLVVSVGISRNDIPDFKALDDEPVRLLIMIAAAYSQHTYYLQTLSFFSSKLKNRELQNALLSSESSADAYRLLTA